MDDKTLHNAGTPDTARAHLAAFPRVSPALPGAAHPAVAQLRAGALARFKEAGIPTRRLEDWKFTGLDALTRTAFAPAEPPADRPTKALIARLAPVEGAVTLVFVNGVFDAALSSPLDGGAVRPLAEALADPGLAEGLSTGEGKAEALVALNAAFMTGGAVLSLAQGTALDAPVVLLFLSGGEGAAVHTRNVITLGPGATARVVEIHATLPGEAPAFSNAVTDVTLADGARLHHARFAEEDKGALHHSHAAVRLGKGAEYASLALSVGGDLTRQESDVTFAAPDGRVRLFGAYLARDHQHMDHTTRVRHDHPGCATEELFKGVMDDHGHGVFQGLIRVAPHAIKTDAHQKNTNLLLSDRAVADTKPELEILADDVKCSHGATVGDLDPDEMFYLRARGLTANEARRLLVAGYVDDLIGRVGDEAIAKLARDRAQAWLAGGDA